MTIARALKILVVDDDDQLRRAVLRLLTAELADVTVAEASSADEALAIIAAGAFDLVFLDFRMPGKSGIDAVRELRASSGNALPVVIMSALPREPYEAAAMRAGANAWVDKARLSDELATLIDSLVGTTTTMMTA